MTEMLIFIIKKFEFLLKSGENKHSLWIHLHAQENFIIKTNTFRSYKICEFFYSLNVAIISHLNKIDYLIQQKKSIVNFNRISHLFEVIPMIK